jgi:phosphoenolpyruvate---glycerone phosphotransferase subunit DhaL
VRRVALGREQVIAWLRALRPAYATNRERLTELDAAIGDADHGISMDRGFTAVEGALSDQTPADIGAIFQSVGMVLIRTAGGASGPLYGTFFLRAGTACAGKTELTAADVVTLFQRGIDGIRQRGKAETGDKTMLDAFVPALAAMRQGMDEGLGLAEIMDAGATAAESGMKATIPMQARKGRASYLGPRSIGHQDPGATSAFLLVKTAADTWRV